jgi:probable rRNA maturation factor
MKFVLRSDGKLNPQTADWMEKLAVLTLQTAKSRSFAETSELSLVLVGDAQMRRLNRQYRGMDKTTDVLSFPLLEGKKLKSGLPTRTLLGDVVISLPQTRKQAKEAGKTFEAEAALLLVHGILHLLGYDHGSKAEEKLMFGLQGQILKKFKV